MSITEVEAFLENTEADFCSSQNGIERVAIVNDLYNRGLDQQADKLMGRWFAEREAYLLDESLKEEDLIVDEDTETFFYTVEHGTPGEDGYRTEEKRGVVPEYLNLNYFTQLIKR